MIERGMIERRDVSHPFRVDATGRAATVDYERHVRDMIYAVLFTSPGERVNLPEFGCGLRELVFSPNRDLLAAATQHLVQASLERWLSDVILVHDVRILNVEERLVVDIAYSLRLDGRDRRERFPAPGGFSP
jgi:phage baseplate assembly protein W